MFVDLGKIRKIVGIVEKLAVLEIVCQNMRGLSLLIERAILLLSLVLNLTLQVM